jgi:ABC-2 type transport system ATP-binding protein
MSTAEPVIDISGLSCAFGGRTVLGGLTLRCGAGAVIGLVGANGGGKTTTLRMLTGLLKPSGGGGTVLGEDVNRPEHARRSRIGYMAQSLALYPELTVSENLRFRCDILCGGSIRPADYVIAKYSLESVLASRIAALSGGWARRVQFAASVLHQPTLILLDEPSAGLDARTRRDMWTWISDLASCGSAVVVSTHDLHEAQQCPQIIHYRDGTAEGPLSPHDLLTRSGTQSLEEAVIAEADG